MNIIPSLRLMAARCAISGILSGIISKRDAMMVVCDEDITYYSDKIQPYQLNFSKQYISSNGIAVGWSQNHLYLYDIKYNSMNCISVCADILHADVSELGILITTRHPYNIYIVKNGRAEYITSQTVNVKYHYRGDLTIQTSDVIILHCREILKRGNIVTYISLPDCYFISTHDEVKVGLSVNDCVTIKDNFGWDTLDVRFVNGKLFFSSKSHHYYGSPYSINKIPRKEHDSIINNYGVYYNSDTLSCYVVSSSGIIEVKKAIEFGRMIISQQNNGVSIFDTEKGGYTGFIPNQYWHEDNENIDNCTMIFDNKHFIVSIEYVDTSTRRLIYTYEGLQLTSCDTTDECIQLTNNDIHNTCIVHPLGITPLPWRRCLELI